MRVLVWKGGENQDVWAMPGRDYGFKIEDGCLVIHRIDSMPWIPVKAYAPGQWLTAETRD
jgi:hypothetical protein